MAKLKTLKIIQGKGKNKRIEIRLMEDEDTGDKAFTMATKTLIDFKTRKIIGTSGLYSIETFAVMKDLMAYMFDDSEIKNKLIHKELSNIRKFEATANF